MQDPMKMMIDLNYCHELQQGHGTNVTIADLINEHEQAIKRLMAFAERMQVYKTMDYARVEDMPLLELANAHHIAITQAFEERGQ